MAIVTLMPDKNEVHLLRIEMQGDRPRLLKQDDALFYGQLPEGVAVVYS